MAYIGTLAINVVANTGRFAAGLNRAGRNVGTFTNTINRSMRVLTPFTAMLGAGVGLGATAGLVRMAKSADEFAGAMNRSVAIMSDVNTEIRADMERTALSVAYNTKYSAREAADAYFYLASAGLDAQQSMAALPAVAKFAQAGNFDLSLATDLATDALSALGLKSEDAATNAANLRRVMDSLTKANTMANASVQQFSEALTNKSGAAMKLYGIRVEEGLAVLAAWADQGVKAEDAGTRFDIVLRDLTTKAIENADAFEKAGIAVYEYGEIRNIADIVRDMESAMGGMTDRGKKATLMQLGFTNKTVSATASLIGLSDAIRDYERQQDSATGTTDKVADNLTDMQAAWNKLGATMQSMSNDVFPPILTSLSQMIDKLAGVDRGLDKTESGWAKLGKALPVIGEAAGMAHRLQDPGTWARMAAGESIQDILAEKQVGLVRPLERDDPKRVAAREARARAAMNRSAASLFGFDRKTTAHPMDSQLGSMRAEMRSMGTYGDKDAIALSKRLETLSKRIEQLTNLPGVQAMSTRLGLGDVDVAGVGVKGVGKVLPGLKEEFAELHEEFVKASEKAAKRVQDLGKRMEQQTRTPMERFKAGLDDVGSLFRYGAINAETATRRVRQLQDIYDRETESKEQQFQGSQFSPAMLQGSLEAYEATILSAYSDNLRDPMETTARATEKMAGDFLKLLTEVKKIERNQTQPEVVELPAGGSG